LINNKEFKEDFKKLERYKSLEESDMIDLKKIKI
jgi:hypothetical protein